MRARRSRKHARCGCFVLKPNGEEQGSCKCGVERPHPEGRGGSENGVGGKRRCGRSELKGNLEILAGEREMLWNVEVVGSCSCVVGDAEVDSGVDNRRGEKGFR